MGTTAQFGGASGDVFSAICGMQIPRFTSSKPSKFAFASDEKSIRQPTTSFVRCYLRALPHNSSAALAMPFLPSASCRNLDLPPVNLRFLQSHLTKNVFAIAPTHLCGIALILFPDLPAPSACAFSLLASVHST